MDPEWHKQREQEEAEYIDTVVSDEIRVIQTTLVKEALATYKVHHDPETPYHSDDCLQVFVHNLISWRVPADTVLSYVKDIDPSHVEKAREIIDIGKSIVPRLPTK